jgi:hypothetical protein
MIKDYSWRIFETTGNISYYMLYRETSRSKNCIVDTKIGEHEGVNLNLKER